MRAAELGNEPRQILLHVPPLPEKHRDDMDRIRARGGKRRHRFGERRAHQLEIRDRDQKILGKDRGDALERPRPLRIARAVGEKDDAELQLICGARISAPLSMQRRAPAFVDALQQPQRAQANGAVRQGVAEVLDDVEGHRHVQPG